MQQNTVVPYLALAQRGQGRYLLCFWFVEDFHRQESSKIALPMVFLIVLGSICSHFTSLATFLAVIMDF